jgi:hypothetical protein
MRNLRKLLVLKAWGRMALPNAKLFGIGMFLLAFVRM